MCECTTGQQIPVFRIIIFNSVESLTECAFQVVFSPVTFEGIVSQKWKFSFLRNLHHVFIF